MRTLSLLLVAATVWGADENSSTKYSPLKQIDTSNVTTLKVAWQFKTGEPTTPLHPGSRTPAFEAMPIVVDGVMYFGTPYGGVFALNAVTGARLWSYDTKINRAGNYGDFANRGVSTWLDSGKRTGLCRRIIYMASIDARLTALDTANGQACPAFGNDGVIDLKTGLRNGPVYAGEYEETSPPAVIGDLVIVGSAIADNNRVKAPSGEVRAFDARTGALLSLIHI